MGIRFRYVRACLRHAIDRPERFHLDEYKREIVIEVRLIAALV